MSVTVAKSAGFCFGVSRAVELVEKTALSGKKTVTYGPIIHNRHVVDRFEKIGRASQRLVTTRSILSERESAFLFFFS